MGTPIDPRAVAPAVEKQGIIAMAKTEGILPAIGKLLVHHPVLSATALAGTIAAGFGIMKLIGGGEKIESFAEKVGYARKAKNGEHEHNGFKAKSEVQAGALYVNTQNIQAEQGAAR